MTTPKRSKERKLSELADLAHLALEKMGLTLVEIINEINMAQVNTACINLSPVHVNPKKLHNLPLHRCSCGCRRSLSSGKAPSSTTRRRASTSRAPTSSATSSSSRSWTRASPTRRSFTGRYRRYTILGLDGICYHLLSDQTVAI